MEIKESPQVFKVPISQVANFRRLAALGEETAELSGIIVRDALPPSLGQEVQEDSALESLQDLESQLAYLAIAGLCSASEMAANLLKAALSGDKLDIEKVRARLKSLDLVAQGVLELINAIEEGQ